MFIQESHFPLIMKALLLYATLTTCSSVEYFIIPSRTSSCISTSCLTFQQFITNFSNYQEKKMILRFGPGNHLFHSKLNVTNVDTLSIMSNSTENFINCSKSAGFIFSNVMTISLTNLSFNGCGKPSRNNVVIKVSNSSISIKNCIFNNSKGRIIELEFSKLVMSKSMFNRSKEGVFIVQKNSTMHDIGSIYELSKSPTKYSAIVYISGSLAKFSKCSFLKTTINGLTDMIYTNNLSSIILEYCEFVNNIIVKSRSTNKYLVQLRCSIIKLDGTVFKQNILHSGKLVYVIHSNISINNSVFEQNSLSNTGVLKLYMSSGHIFHNLQITRNSAKIGILRFYQSYVQIYDNLVITQNKVNRAVMLIDQSKVEVYQNIIIKENHAFLSTIDIYKSTLWFFGNIMFISNYGSIFIEESLVSLETSTFFDNVQTKQNKTYTTLYELGGAITSIWSVLHLNGRTEFCENHSWKIGGAINAIQSKVYIHSAALFTDNTAKKGGAIYLDHSDLICQNECSFVGNRATSRGGAIHATDSLISIGKEWYEYQQRSNHDNSLLRFVNNSAKNGGGLSFEAKSKLHGPLQANYKYVIEFNNNTAVKGGAIYVDDYTNVDTCGNTSYSTCFLQTPFFGSDSKWNGLIIIKSKMDTNTIYGGLLDRCVAKSDYVDIYKTKSYKKGVDYLKKHYKGSNH